MSIDRTSRSTRAILVAVGAAGIAGLASNASAQCDTYNVASQTTAYVSATNDIGNACDDCVTPITFPFAVNLYGTAYTTAFASSNGNLQFGGAGSGSFGNTCPLPSATFAGFPVVFPHWDDLRTDEGGGIFTEVIGTSPNQRFVVEWRATYFGSGGTPVNFEVIFYEGQTYFDVVYGTVTNTGVSATAGVQFQNTGPSTQYSCNASSIASGSAIRYTCASLTPGACCAPNGTCSSVVQTSCPSPSTFTSGGVCAPNPCPQPPANDECTGAFAVSPGSSTSGTNNLASGTDITACAFGDTDDVWFTFTTTTAGFYVIDTEGTVGGLDTTLAIYNTCPAGAEIACDDDGGTGLLSRINVNLPASTQHWIRVAGYAGANGNFQLNVGTGVAPPPPPANDTCAAATVITSLPFSDAIEIAGATDDADLASCNAAAATVTPQGVWYRYTPAANQRIRVAEGSIYNTFLSVFTSDSGCAGSFSEVPNSCGFDEAIEVTAGTTYYILIGSAATAGLPPPVLIDFSITQILPPANDTCATAVVVSSLPFTDTTTDITGASDDADLASCNAAAASVTPQAVWYRYTPTANQRVRFSEFSPYNTFLSVFTSDAGCAGTFTELPAACGFNVVVDVTAGTTYYIMVGSAAEGPIGPGVVLDLSITEVLPITNDTCGTATVVTGTLSGSIDNSDAANENDEPLSVCNALGAVGLDNSIWFTFTPGASGPLAGSIDGFYDIIATLYSGTCGAAGLTEVACYDSEPIDLSLDEDLNPVNLVAGTQYFLAIGDWGVTDGGGQTDFTITVPGGGPVNGACCIGTTCTTGTAASCVGANTSFAGAGTVCNPAINSTTPCCKADFNHVGGVTVQDIFDFLNAYFSGAAPADINGGGVSVQDIFDFLSAYFAGCP